MLSLSSSLDDAFLFRLFPFSKLNVNNRMKCLHNTDCELYHAYNLTRVNILMNEIHPDCLKFLKTAYKMFNRVFKIIKWNIATRISFYSILNE